MTNKFGNGVQNFEMAAQMCDRPVILTNNIVDQVNQKLKCDWTMMTQHALLMVQLPASILLCCEVKEIDVELH